MPAHPGTVDITRRIFLPTHGVRNFAQVEAESPVKLTSSCSNFLEKFEDELEAVRFTGVGGFLDPDIFDPKHQV